MNKKIGIIAVVLSVIAVLLSGFSLYKTLTVAGAAKRDVQYVLYLGTNDKDTNEPVFTPKEAKEKAEEILMNHFGGYTLQEAEGGWADGYTLYQEYTLVIYLSNTDLDAVHKASNELIQVFHQSSVLIQANETMTEFYAGKS
ncbi:MAG: hypothetical protein ACSW75_00535 [Lachnospiraceae bacterium]